MGKDKKGESVFITEDDIELFHKGIHYTIYHKLGAHICENDGLSGVYFALWAPNANEVTVIGTFNNWDTGKHKMTAAEDGLFTLFIPSAGKDDLYKFCIRTHTGRLLFKADPYANACEMRPGNASKIADLNTFIWKDENWISNRKSDITCPMSIYEVHIGSWMRHPDGKNEGFYNYREFAYRIVEYLREIPYTHVELMGIAEHPFDGSWGYQVTGYYAPTSRYGTPEDFMFLVNYLHENNIGVILDWVPAHFPKDEHGLADFDGTCLYEYEDPKKGEHPDWGTKIFDYEKKEVSNFLIANALFWINEYHVDGLRVDAVASMLYLDYGKQQGQWIPNIYGGNKNLEAIEFFKHLNSIIRHRHPGIMMIAEESTAWPSVTKRPEENGLGFHYKWNMGWMHDFLDYMKLDPLYRKYHHHKMTFAMAYHYSENFILVLSHDEVVHLKCSMINKMPGDRENKFHNLKAAYAFMFTHPGKKLLFMGQDFGQEREWSESRELDWYLLGDDNHRSLHNFMKELLHLYRENPAFYELDMEQRGFQWINADDADRSIFSYIRYSSDGKNNFLCIFNFTPVERKDYRVGVPKNKKYKLVLNSDDLQFGGKNTQGKAYYPAEKIGCDSREYSIAFGLPGYGAVIFRF